MQLKEFTLMLLVGKSVLMGIYLNAVERVTDIIFKELVQAFKVVDAVHVL